MPLELVGDGLEAALELAVLAGPVDVSSTSRSASTAYVAFSRSSRSRSTRACS
jgi:hypothetical protein